MDARFKSHKLTPEGEYLSNNIKVQASILLHDLETSLPSCREKDLAIDRLRECIMWSTNAVANNS